MQPSYFYGNRRIWFRFLWNLAFASLSTHSVWNWHCIALCTERALLSVHYRSDPMKLWLFYIWKVMRLQSSEMILSRSRCRFMNSYFQHQQYANCTGTLFTLPHCELWCNSIFYASFTSTQTIPINLVRMSQEKRQRFRNS